MKGSWSKGSSQLEHSVSTYGDGGMVERSGTLLEGLVDRLRENPDQRRVEVAYRTGELIVEQLYQGDLDAWRRRPKGDALYALLESHPRLPISRAELYRSLRVFELGRRHPDFVSGDLLTLSHLLCVLSLPHDQQSRLLHRAIQGRWTVRHLRDTVANTVEHSDAVPSGTGRPRIPPVLKTLRGPLAFDSAFEGIESLVAVDGATAASLLDVCRRTRSAIDRIENTLQRSGRAGREARVMVVDDNPSFTTRAQRELRKHVRSVRIAHSCSQAVMRIDHQISCAAINLSLPDGCGFALSERLRKDYSGLRCVFITAVPRDDLPPHVRQADPLVPKTSALTHLSVAVLQALNRPA